MKKLIFAFAGLATAALFAAPASAGTFFPGDPEFQVSGNISSGPVSASIGNAGIGLGAFQDSYFFTINQTGVGSGSLTTSSSIFQGVTDLDISSVLVNGFVATKVITTPQALAEFFSIVNVPIFFGGLNTIVVTGVSHGNGSYGGNLTFVPFVPEPATWVMMFAGFGMVGAVARRRSSAKLVVSYA